MELTSALWYRVAALRPRLRSHIEIHRHVYRGEGQYVLQDGASRQLHTFNHSAYVLIGLMDGRRPMQDVWARACEQLKEHAPTQDDLVRLLATLHRAGVLASDLSPDIEELLRRSRTMR